MLFSVDHNFCLPLCTVHHLVYGFPNPSQKSDTKKRKGEKRIERGGGFRIVLTCYNDDPDLVNERRRREPG